MLFSLYLCFILLSLSVTNGLLARKVLLPKKILHQNLKMAETINITPDGRITKEIITRGQGKAIETGDILAIEYTAKVKGSQTPFSRGDKEKFVFKDGTMIKGWDIGIGSMKIGENACIHINSEYAYGSKGVYPVIIADSDIEIDVKILAWLGNQLNPETLFQKDLDIDPFIASTPEAIQAEFDTKQANINERYKGNFIEIYWNRLKNISFGFGGSNFFASQTGERPPWWLNPNITFPTMISITLAAFITVFFNGGVREKGETRIVDSDSAPISVTVNNQ